MCMTLANKGETWHRSLREINVRIAIVCTPCHNIDVKPRDGYLGVHLGAYFSLIVGSISARDESVTDMP